MANKKKAPKKDRKEYFAQYYQKNKEKLNTRTIEYYKMRGKDFKRTENQKYLDKISPDRKRRSRYGDGQ